MHERKHLGNVNVSQRVHDRVEHVVDEDHADDGAGCLLVLRHCIVCAGAGPAGEDGCHADKCYEILGAAVELFREECAGHAGDEVPAGQSKVDLVLLAPVCDADCG